MTDVKLPPRPDARYWQMGLYGEQQMDEYARQAVLQERERCAKLADKMAQRVNSTWIAEEIADAIRKGQSLP